MTKSEKKAIIYREYGKNPLYHCKDCCNCQNAENSTILRVCIAFGTESADGCHFWDPENMACGIYNVPFSTLIPHRRPILAVYGRGERSASPIEGQISLF